MSISISNTGVLASNTGLFDEIGQYMNFYDEANTTLYFDATGRFPYSTSTTGTWLNLAPTAKYIVANTTALGATVSNTYGPNAMIFTNIAGTAGRIDRTAASNTIIGPAITSGTGKMTAAVWAYNTNWYQTAGQRYVSSTQTGGWSIALNDSGFTGTTSVGIVFYNITAGGYRYMEANTRTAFASSTGWNHLAWTFDGKYGYFYINGQVANTYTAAAATNYIDVGGCLAIGAESSSNTATTTPYLSGAMASIFVSNRSFTNTEIYNLFVDTDPNINLPGSRTYVVNSTYSTATTVAPTVPAKYYSNGALRTTGTIGFDEVSMNSGSLFFDGSTQYLTGPATPAALGTGNFTIEMWLNPTAVSSSSGYCLLDTRATGSGSTGWVVGIQSGNLTIQNAGTQYLTSSGTISAGVWSHVAWVRSGTTVTVYINGVASGTATNSTDHTASLFGIAKPTFTSSSQLNYGGYITNVRIVPGIALYTSNFTPPRSSVLEAVSNTSLLLQCANSTNYIVDSSPYQYTITNNGSVTFNANSIYNYTNSGTVVQKIYSDGTLAVKGNLDEIAYFPYTLLAVGGGGGGAQQYNTWTSGGGGGGGVIYSGVTLQKGASYTITVGGGGAGYYNNASGSGQNGGNGGNTTISLSGTPIYVAYGGGGGGKGNYGTGGGGSNGLAGGSSGGSANTVNVAPTQPTSAYGGYGSAGGQGVNGGGGGGGAGGPGQNSALAGGAGGPGIAISITGSTVYYGAGGGGSGDNTYGGGAGGTGGGGAGNGTGYPWYGSDGTGYGAGGGGGGANYFSGSGSGNAGIVIFSYPSATQTSSGGTVTSYTDGNGVKYWVHTFTSNGTFTPG